MDNLIANNLKVLVFRSNINTGEKTDQIRKALLDSDQIYQVDVDLDDVDNVLRVVCHPDFPSKQLREQVYQLGFECAPLL